MKHFKRLFYTGGFCLGLTILIQGTLMQAVTAAPPQMLAQLNPMQDKVVRVQFRPNTSAAFVQKLSNAFSAPVTKIDANTYVFQVPALKTQDQYAELFSALPSVMDTVPMPVYKVADHIQPQAVNIQPVNPNGTIASPNPAASPSSQQAGAYLPGEMMVKFKPGVTAADIAFLNQNMGVSQISRIAGIDVYRLRLPQGLLVPEAVASYQQSELVDFAEPNYTMSLPQPVNGPNVLTPIPLDGGGQMLIHFRPGSAQEVIDKFQLIYGTRWVQKTSFYSYRVQLPAGLNAAIAARVFKLYPGVSDVQRLYS
jgi:hypothetical protein